MYYIAICDNDESVCAEIKAILLEHAAKLNLQVEVDIFYSGVEMNQVILSDNHYNIIFLEVNLEVVSGIEIANNIRDTMGNEAMKIIYMSAETDRAMELFRARPVDFLVKPLKKERITYNLEEAIRLLQTGRPCFEFYVGHNFYRRPYADIMYFQSNERKITLVTVSEKIPFYGKLDEIVKQLPETHFVRIHQSFVLNYDFIIEYSYDWVKMQDGSVFTISRGKRTFMQDLLFTKCKNATRKKK